MLIEGESRRTWMSDLWLVGRLGSAKDQHVRLAGMEAAGRSEKGDRYERRGCCLGDVVEGWLSLWMTRSGYAGKERCGED